MRKERLIEIKSDVFDVADRIREVDARYHLFYNLDRSRFEVRLQNREGELAVTWSEPLDCRLITKLRETHVRRLSQLVRELEEAEEKAKIEEESRIREAAGEKTEEFMRLAWRSRG